MTRAKGLVIKLPSNRVELFNEYASDEWDFSEPVPYFPHDNSVPILCFILEANLMTHISLGHGGQAAGTNLRRVNLSSILPLSHPVEYEIFGNNIAENTAKSIASKFEEGGLLTQRGLEHVVRTLLEVAPETEPLLSRFTSSFEKLLNSLSPRELSNLAIQKEAILTALLVAGQDFDRRVIRSWTPTERPLSFLDGLTEQRLDESQMIRNDFENLPGYSAMSGHIKGTAIFYSPSEVLTVVYADREPLEQLTGADLIYFHERYRSFVFVQYKVLGDDGYRLDEQLQREIRRMEDLLMQAGSPSIQQCADFRLHNNPFFLKLCPRIDFEPESSSLTKGMYIPLAYWNVLNSFGCLTGSRGGQVATFENVERYFTNTDFSTLVTKGWVGSDSTQSSILAPMIEETLRAGRAALYAFKTVR